MQFCKNLFTYKYLTLQTRDETPQDEMHMDLINFIQ